MRIYRPYEGSNLFSNVHTHWLPFDLEHEKWTYVDSISDAQIVPIVQHKTDDAIKQELGKLRDDQLLIMLMLFHMNDNQDTFEQCEEKASVFRDHAKHVSIVHSNAWNNHPDHVYNDIMWNRHKAYYTEYDKHDLRDRLWSLWATQQQYQYCTPQKHPNAKKFLCLNRIYYDTLGDPRMKARAMLAEHLRDRDGFVSDPQRHQIIEPEAMTTNMRYHLLSGAGTWWPAAHYYYENSYINIYIETLTISTHASLISEKTYDAFMNGNYILPFGYAGMIKDILDRGFMLPDWIDYSYDDIPDFNQRFSAFMQEVDRVLKLSISELHEHWLQDKYPLWHNRQHFWIRPYDELHSKVEARYNLTCR